MSRNIRLGEVSVGFTGYVSLGQDRSGYVRLGHDISGKFSLLQVTSG